MKAWKAQRETRQVGKGTYGRIRRRHGAKETEEYFILPQGEWRHRQPLPKAHKESAEEAFAA